MNQEHLSENELQQWALGQNASDQQLAAHIQACPACAAAAANYQALFSALHAIEKPAFKLDIDTQIMAHLPVATTTRSAFPWLQLLLGAAAVAVLTITVLVMSSYLKEVFQGMDTMIFSLLMVVALTIALFQCREIWITHRRKMNQLKFY